MTTPSDSSTSKSVPILSLARLRQQAEQQLSESQVDLENLSLAETRHMVQELQIHQIELEMQNEALREAQLLLEEARDAYARLYHEAPLGYLTIDGEGYIVQANQRVAKMLGTRPNALKGKSFFHFILREQRDDFYLFQRNLQRGINATANRLEIQLVNPVTNAVFDGELYGLWLPSDHQHKQGVLRLTVTDVTERKQQDEALIHTQKWESLGVMAGGTAHLVNNMLATIGLHMDMARHKLDESHPALGHILQVQKLIKQEAQVFEKLLDYTGDHLPEFTAVDMHTLIEQNAPLLRATGLYNHHLTLDLAAPMYRIHGNAPQLQQMLLNLVSNASEAYEKGNGSVTIRTALAQNGQFELFVEDNGRGIAANDLERVFEPFFTTKFFGRGLGLAATAGIVARHEGSIHIESQQGQGTTVRVRLPLHVEQTEAEGGENTAMDKTEPNVPPALAQEPQQKKILIIDDEAELGEIIGEVLEFAGYETHIFTEGHKAITQFEAMPNAFTAVLLDLTMPDIHGSDVMRHLRQINPDVPIIIMTGFSPQEAAQSLHEQAPPAGFLRKPFPLNELIQTIEAILLAPKT